MTYDIVQANPGHHWCYRWFSKNPSLTWEDVEAHPDIPWDYLNLSMNCRGRAIDPASRIRTQRRCKMIGKELREEAETFKERLCMRMYHPDRLQGFLDAGMTLDEAIDALDTYLGWVYNNA
jgi:hypothetical protein